MCVPLFSLRDRFFSRVYNEVGERCSFMTTLSCSTRLETRTKESHMCARFWALNMQARWNFISQAPFPNKVTITGCLFYFQAASLNKVIITVYRFFPKAPLPNKVIITGYLFYSSECNR